MGASKIAEYARFTERSKHFNVKFHFTRDEVRKNTISSLHTPSNANLADLFTKILEYKLEICLQSSAYTVSHKLVL